MGEFSRADGIERARYEFDRARQKRAAPRRRPASTRQVYEQLRAGLRSGVFTPDALLEEKRVMEATSAGRNAVRRALRILAGEGLLNRTPRNGTSIARPILVIPSGEVLPQGSTGTDASARITVREIDNGVTSTTPLIRSRLGTDINQVAFAEQVFLADGEPYSVRISYMLISDEAAPDPGAVADTITELDRRPLDYEAVFERLYGTAFGRSESTVEAVACEEPTAELLGIPAGAPVLLREVLVYDSAGRLRDLSYTYSRGDRVALRSQTRP